VQSHCCCCSGVEPVRPLSVGPRTHHFAYPSHIGSISQTSRTGHSRGDPHTSRSSPPGHTRLNNHTSFTGLMGSPSHMGTTNTDSHTGMTNQTSLTGHTIRNLITLHVGTPSHTRLSRITRHTSLSRLTHPTRLDGVDPWPAVSTLLTLHPVLHSLDFSPFRYTSFSALSTPLGGIPQSTQFGVYFLFIPVVGGELLLLYTANNHC